MKLKIITPEETLFDGEAEAATFPGLAGSFDVLPHHAPLITALRKGVIRYRVENKEYEQAVGSGFVKVENDELSVCVEQ